MSKSLTTAYRIVKKEEARGGGVAWSALRAGYGFNVDDVLGDGAAAATGGSSSTGGGLVGVVDENVATSVLYLNMDETARDVRDRTPKHVGMVCATVECVLVAGAAQGAVEGAACRHVLRLLRVRGEASERPHVEAAAILIYSRRRRGAVARRFREVDGNVLDHRIF